MSRDDDEIDVPTTALEGKEMLVIWDPTLHDDSEQLPHVYTYTTSEFW